jgi:P4 family phage/plasmid primase-like protien
MIKTMNTTSQYKDLNEFLAKHSAKNVEGKKVGETTNITHTRIGDKDLNIYGGSYIIPNELLETFYELYYESIFIKNRKEYLTEKQLELNGPMAVDFDFRYSPDINTRQHSRSHISDMVCEYAEILKDCYLIEPNKTFDIFVCEKPNVNKLTDDSLTKDGIHMIIGMQIDHTMQVLIRERMIEKLNEIWDGLPLTNSWDSVLDEGISKGTTNWQLFGSRKPGNEAYELTHHYLLTIDGADGEFQMDEKDVKDFDLKNNFYKLSVQNIKNPKFEINPKIIDEYNKRLENKINKITNKKASSKIKMNLIMEDDDNPDEQFISINDINNKETLEKAVNIMLSHLKTNEYEIAETHYFTQALPEKYYNPGSHLLNRQVAFALKHTDDRLFLSWVQLRSKAIDFDYNSILELYGNWKKFHKTNQDGTKVTRKSIMYWVRKDNFEEYEKIKQNTIDYYIEKALETGTEYDIALVLKQMYKDKYVCVSYEKRGIWYQFKNHRWIPDRGLSLRSKISEEVYALLSSKSDYLGKQIQEYQEDDERRIFIQKKIKLIGEINIKLKKTNDKDHIMREAAEIFYDGEFIKNMDTNKYLMCFNNGVVDFVNKVFREGYPEDYITKTTKINYIHYDENYENDEEYKRTVNEIEVFMNKLFPIPDLNRYMRDHLASCLIGTNKNQTFNVYHGSGSNGKSIIADLMSVTLGDYKGTVPITLVTDVRGKIGGTSDEVLKLKGVRYAVMQEPSKGVKLNEGIMKELTGGDPIQARGLYSESEIFEPQFSLVVCTNNLFDIESNDDGTWRRIRKCDFISKFIDEGETHTDDTQYVYLKDKSLKDKLPLLAPVFASILVKRAFETNGIVEDCETVLRASNKYRNGQDHISAFINEKIIKTNSSKDKIGKRGLQEGFKLWFELTQGSRKQPKGTELFDYMNKKFGECKNTGWHYIKFLEPDDEECDMLAEL